jgi:hypothetical protein
MRIPVAEKMALVTAGATGGVPGSPPPPSGASLCLLTGGHSRFAVSNYAAIQEPVARAGIL